MTQGSRWSSTVGPLLFIICLIDFINANSVLQYNADKSHETNLLSSLFLFFKTKDCNKLLDDETKNICEFFELNKQSLNSNKANFVRFNQRQRNKTNH